MLLGWFLAVGLLLMLPVVVHFVLTRRYKSRETKARTIVAAIAIFGALIVSLTVPAPAQPGVTRVFWEWAEAYSIPVLAGIIGALGWLGVFYSLVTGKHLKLAGHKKKEGEV